MKLCMKMNLNGVLFTVFFIVCSTLFVLFILLIFSTYDVSKIFLYFFLRKYPIILFSFHSRISSIFNTNYAIEFNCLISNNSNKIKFVGYILKQIYRDMEVLVRISASRSINTVWLCKCGIKT